MTKQSVLILSFIIFILGFLFLKSSHPKIFKQENNEDLEVIYSEGLNSDNNSQSRLQTKTD